MTDTTPMREKLARALADLSPHYADGAEWDSVQLFAAVDAILAVLETPSFELQVIGAKADPDGIAPGASFIAMVKAIRGGA